jgi:hypothetical protein
VWQLDGNHPKIGWFPLSCSILWFTLNFTHHPEGYHQNVPNDNATPAELPPASFSSRGFSYVFITLF